MATIYQILATKNDTNGNPRRRTAAYDTNTGDMIALRDHGYSGPGLPRGGEQLPGVDITPGQYRDLRKLAKEKDLPSWAIGTDGKVINKP